MVVLRDRIIIANRRRTLLINPTPMTANDHIASVVDVTADKVCP